MSYMRSGPLGLDFKENLVGQGQSDHQPAAKNATSPLEPCNPNPCNEQKRRDKKRTVKNAIERRTCKQNTSQNTEAVGRLLCCSIATWPKCTGYRGNCKRVPQLRWQASPTSQFGALIAAGIIWDKNDLTHLSLGCSRDVDPSYRLGAREEL